MLQKLSDNAISGYAASLKDKASLVPALYKVIRENYSDVSVLFLFVSNFIKEVKDRLGTGGSCTQIQKHIIRLAS